MLRLARYSLFCLVLLLAAYLRCTGLSWGVESGYGHTREYQPDEFISLRGVLEIDYQHGQLRVPGAYFEGTFNYYLWAVPLAARVWLSGASHGFDQLSNMDDFRYALLSGRMMSVLSDLATVFFIYLVIIELTRSVSAGLTGAFLYSIMPMQVIYTHFMRTHVLSNLLCILVIWLSFRLRRGRKWWLLLLIGLLSGLGMATRYPIGIIVSIPCLVLLFEDSARKAEWKRWVTNFVLEFVRGPCWLIGLGFITGLFIGDPMLFLDTRGVVDAVVHQTFHYVPANAARPFDLVPLWKYLSVLIPYALYPLLWIVAYASVIYLCFRRRLYHITMPLLLFALFYSYPMAKSYLIFIARQVMLLLPALCILISVAMVDLHGLIGRRRIASIGLGAIVLLLAVPSLVFDYAYVSAMTEPDIRTVVRNDLRRELGDTPATINVSKRGGYFYAAMPAVVPLRNATVTVSETSQPATYLVLASERPFRSGEIRSETNTIESEGHFKLAKIYSRAPTIWGAQFDLSAFPPDMTYPFVPILLFKSTAR